LPDAEIIAIGSELLTPQRVDTNSLFLTEELNGLGVEVTTKCIVGDDRHRLADVVRRAVGRSQIVILSGGLGPTEDDVTRDAVAQAIDRKMIFHPEIANQIEHRFQQMGRKMPEINKRQAFIIEGAEMLPNDRGTAPGQWIEESGAWIMLLPGPPHELKAMFTRQCMPRLERRVPKQHIQTLTLRVAGMSESDLDQTIAPVYKKYENPVTTILAHASDIQVILRARCTTELEANALLAELGGQIDILLGDRIYSRNGDPLEVVVGDLLKKHHATLAVAESMTGGGLAERISSIPGSSEYFVGGFITYTKQMKIDLLGVPPNSNPSPAKWRKPWPSPRAEKPEQLTVSRSPEMPAPLPTTETLRSAWSTSDWPIRSVPWCSIASSWQIALESGHLPARWPWISYANVY